MRPLLSAENAMDTKQFLLQVVPSNGIYYLGTVDKGRYNEKAIPTFAEVEEFIANAKKLNKDIYFATSSYNDTSTRQASNIKSKKSLYLDLDCGEGKGFTSKKEAIVSLVTFCKTIKLPAPSVIVDSGNGIHAYWVLDKSISPDEWLPMAIRLKDLCAEHSFPADMSITADSARIMRVPGTKNYKGSLEGKDCKILKTTGTSVDVKLIRNILQAPPMLSVIDGLDASPDDLSGGLDYGTQKFLAKNIIEQCPTMQEIALTGGSSCSEPLWKQTLNLLAFCADGEQYKHPLSEKHPTYSEQSTDIKFKAGLKSAELGKTGPTLCKTFAENSMSKCSECPHNGNIKSPIVLGKPLPSELPHGYFSDKFGTHRIPMNDAEDVVSPVLVCPYEITGFSVNNSLSEEGLIIDFTAKIGSHKEQKVSFPQASLNDKRTTANAASRNGIVLTPKQAGEFSLLMNTWTQQMQAASKVGNVINNYGWVNKGDQKGFSTNNKVFWQDGTEQEVSMAGNVLSGQYKPTGDLEPWKKAAEYIIQQGRPELITAVATGFAAPLINLTGVSGTLVSIVSNQSGTGKSSAMKVAQSVWGCPIRGINSLGDTPNSLAKRLGALCNLPAYWDELRMQENIDSFIGVAFQMSQGKEKSRLTQSAAMQDMGTWNTMMTAASNESLYEHVLAAIQNSNAGVVRIFELTMREANYTNDVANTQMMFKLLESNYGNAGQVYGKYLAENEKTIAANIDKLIVNISKEVSAHADERFWVATVASLVMGALLANKCGLTNFNVPSFKAYLMDEFKRMRATSRKDIVIGKGSIKDIINDFINENGNQIYRVDQIPTNKNAKVTTPIPPKMFPVVAMVDNSGSIRLSLKGFKDWAYKNNVWNSSIVDTIVSNGGSKARRSITCGLHVETSNTVNWVIDIPSTTMDAITKF